MYRLIATTMVLVLIAACEESPIATPLEANCPLPAGVEVTSLELTSGQGQPLTVDDPTTADIESTPFSVTAEINAPQTELTYVCFAVKRIGATGKVLTVGMVGLQPGETRVTRDGVFEMACADNLVTGVSQFAELDDLAIAGTTDDMNIRLRHVESWPAAGAMGTLGGGTRSERLRVMCPQDEDDGDDNNDTPPPPPIPDIPQDLLDEFGGAATQHCEVNLSWNNVTNRCESSCLTNSFTAMLGYFSSDLEPSDGPGNDYDGVYMRNGTAGFLIQRDSHTTPSETNQDIHKVRGNRFAMIPGTSFDWAFAASATTAPTLPLIEGAFPPNTSGLWELQSVGTLGGNQNACVDANVRGGIWFR